MVRIVVGVLILLATSSTSQAFLRWHGHLPECHSNRVIGRILERFAWAEQRTWHRGFVIEGVDKIQETALRTQGPSKIDRRYCNGVAWLSNGQTSEVVYVIEARQGFVSVGWRVEFCLPPYDPWRIYDGWCKAIRP